jgi:hypothetical protein
MNAPFPDNEEQRIAKLLSYNILDTRSETAYDDLTHLASYICQAPIALVSLVDRDRHTGHFRQSLESEIRAARNCDCEAIRRSSVG